MKFWKALRWLVAALFLAIVLMSWLGTAPGTGDARAVPKMIR